MVVCALLPIAICDYINFYNIQKKAETYSFQNRTDTNGYFLQHKMFELIEETKKSGDYEEFQKYFAPSLKKMYSKEELDNLCYDFFNYYDGDYIITDESGGLAHLPFYNYANCVPHLKTNKDICIYFSVVVYTYGGRIMNDSGIYTLWIGDINERPNNYVNKWNYDWDVPMFFTRGIFIGYD